MFICWYLWKWRNQFIFNAEEVVPSNPRQIILSAVSEWSKASCGCRAVGEKVQSLLAWDFPGTAVVNLMWMGHIKRLLGILVLEAFFVIAMGNGLGDLL